MRNGDEPESQAAGSGGLSAFVEHFFSDRGPLAAAKNFEYRPQQQAMAVSVMQALERGGHLIVEAGTGVGKSLAYLVPAILFAVQRKRKAVLSTQTINLQEQLTDKDLPMLQKVLKEPFQFTMLKGRANYLCTRRLDRALRQAGSLFTNPEVQELRRIFEWAQTTRDGSLSDFDQEPDLKVWAQVCSERGSCSPKLCGAKSAFAADNPMCFFQKARSRILAADVLVLNHTLFFSLLGDDEESGEEGLLFRNDFVVFDEAHSLEKTASRHIGISVSRQQTRYALNRLWNSKTQKGLMAIFRQRKIADQVAQLHQTAEAFFDQLEEAGDFLAASRGTNQQGGNFGRRQWKEIRVRQPNLVEDSLAALLAALQERLGDLIEQVGDRDTAGELQECCRRLGEIRDSLSFFLAQKGEGFVYWMERGGKLQRNVSLNAAPVDIAGYLRQRLFQQETSLILTSATLSTAAPSSSDAPGVARAVSNPPRSDLMKRGLDYFASRVGGEDIAALLQVGSPFDYRKQMRVYVAGGMPDPRSAEFGAALVRWVRHFLEQTHGKAFVLFTNSRTMNDVHEALRPELEAMGLRPLLQGAGVPRSALLEQFKQDTDSVLFGLDSFWQGVDVPGESLSNVIITKLPFAVPDHPLIEAQIESIENRGGNPFFEHSLPEAVLKFRQGVGRLIRTKSDRGMIAVLDNRVVQKQYGKAFLAAIPPCPVEVV